MGIQDKGDYKIIMFHLSDVLFPISTTITMFINGDLGSFGESYARLYEVSLVVNKMTKIRKFKRFGL